MSYQPYRGPPMGRGYGPPAHNPSYYPPGPGGPRLGGPPRHMMPPGPGYVGHPDYDYEYDYDPNPSMTRGGVPHAEPMGFGRGYGNVPPVPRAPPTTAPTPMTRNPSTSMQTREVVPGGSHSGYDSGSASEDPRPSGGRFANDCEIIVTQKSQREYGEMVERQLRDYGLTVDIMFPKGDVKLQEFLKPIARMGTIFVVVIEPENEMARTVNFYQFRGQPKPTYHKNVPLTMAYDLINKNYNELKQKEIGAVPEAIKHLLSRVLNEQTLKDNDYTTMIRFLQERRKRQNGFLNRTSNVVSAEHHTDVNSLIDTPDGKELQKRILAILNEGPPSVEAGKRQ